MVIVKGIVGLCEVLIHSQCIKCSRWTLACPQLREAESYTSAEAKQCTAVDRVSSKTYFSHLNEGPLKKKSISVQLCLTFSELYLANNQPFPLGLH